MSRALARASAEIVDKPRRMATWARRHPERMSKLEAAEDPPRPSEFAAFRWLRLLPCTAAYLLQPATATRSIAPSGGACGTSTGLPTLGVFLWALMETLLPRAPTGTFRPTRGWAFTAMRLIIHRLRRRITPWFAMYFVDKLGKAYVLVMLKFDIRPHGGVAPGAALTPQKRGPSPPLTGREGRLPFWTAAPSRPLFLQVLPFSRCMKFLNALWAELKTWVFLRLGNVAIVGAQRARGQWSG